MQKVFIGSIKKNSQSADLQTKLEEFGFINKAEILHPSDGVISKGFAIVNLDFKNINLDSFLKSKISYEGANLYLSRYLEGDAIKKRNEELSRKKVFVSGIPDSFTNDQLLKLFSHFGGIETAYINRRRKIKKKKVEENQSQDNQETEKVFFGFVTFLEEESAIRCLEAGVKDLGSNFEVNSFTPKPLTDFKEKSLGDIKQPTPQKQKKNKKKKNRKKKKVRKQSSGIMEQEERRRQRRRSSLKQSAVLRASPLCETQEVRKNHRFTNLRFNRPSFTENNLRFNRSQASFPVRKFSSFTDKNLLNVLSFEQQFKKETFGLSGPSYSFTKGVNNRHF